MGRNAAFMTHNGLKVRLNYDFCADYLDEEKILPWYISIEAFDSLRGLLAIIVAIIMIFNHGNPIYVGLVIATFYLFGYYISQSFFEMALLNLVYGFIYMLYSYLSKFFIQYIALVVIAIICKEYWLLLSYVAARIACYVILTIINIIQSKYILKKYGVYMGDVERTAAKMIQFYSSKNIKYKQWVKEYSSFINDREAAEIPN